MIEILSHTACRQLSRLFVAIILFDSVEYILAIGFHGISVPLKSPLMSRLYLQDLALTLLEYFLEIVLFPSLKEHWWISNTGLAIVVIGEIIRKIAIITAGEAFTLTIRTDHNEHHRLVTHGIYGFFRHPGYCGMLLWYIGTQIIVCNPISTVAFSIIVWRFFAERIAYEESFLRRIFSSRYEEYAWKVPSGVPFIK